MSRVVSVGIADAPYKTPQREVKDFVRQLFSNAREDIERIVNVFDNSMIKSRHFTQPREWASQQHNFKERNELYVKNACILSAAATKDCIKKINAELSDFDHILFIAVELCSLTFQRDDDSKSNIIATAIFSDGAAAALVVGRENKLFHNKGINLIDSLSTTYYDSLDVMGWKVVDNGLKVIFSKDIPTIVRKCVRPNISELTQKHNLLIEDIKNFVTHPGGPKVINAYEESLNLTNGSLERSI